MTSEVRVPSRTKAKAGRKPGTMAVREQLATEFERYFARIYGYAMYRLQDPEEADEVAAKTFSAAISSSGKYDPGKGTLEAWLLGISRNQIRKHFRSQRVQRAIHFQTHIPPVATDSRWIEEVASENELLAILLPLVGQLRLQEREVLSLKFGAGMSNRQIAQVLKLSESNVGVILYRTLRRLRDELEEHTSDQERLSSGTGASVQSKPGRSYPEASAPGSRS
jgi:RNA polymerase sigma factor (sigma-70 family)